MRVLAWAFFAMGVVPAYLCRAIYLVARVLARVFGPLSELWLSPYVFCRGRSRDPRAWYATPRPANRRLGPSRYPIPGRKSCRVGGAARAQGTAVPG